MHPELRGTFRLLNRLGVPISDRNITGGYSWDGSTLGVRWGEGHYVAPFDLLHEAAHWVVSLDWSKDLPEFGLYSGVGSYGADGGLDKWGDDLFLAGGEVDWVEAERRAFAIQATQDGLLPDEEQNKQEFEAYLLGLYFCRQVGVSFVSKFHIAKYYGSRREIVESTANKSGVAEGELLSALTWAKGCRSLWGPTNDMDHVRKIARSY